MDGPRALRREELADLVVLLDAVFRQAGGASMSADYPQLLNDGNCDHLRVFADQGRIVAHIGYVVRDIRIRECTFKAGLIGSVAVHNDVRGKGLATQLLHDAFAKMDSEDVDLALISGGRGLYLRNGGAPVCRFHEVEVGVSSLDSFVPEEMIIEKVESMERVGPVSAMYEREPVRFLRHEMDWEYFFQCRRSMSTYSSICLIRSGDREAYAVVADNPLEGYMKVLEFAGDRELVLGGLRDLGGERGAEGILLFALETDEVLLDLVRQKDCKEKAGLDHETVRIINFPRLIGKLEPRVKAVLGDKVMSAICATQEEKMVLEAGGEILEYDPFAASEMLFKGKDAPDMLRGVLPLEVPWYGLNYI